MQFQIVYLADHRELVPVCALWAFNTWGKYNSSYTLEKRMESFTLHCNTELMPLTIVALNEASVPIGMASLRANDGIRPELSPWLGSVYVDPPFRGKGIAARLVQEIHIIAHELGFKTIFLLTYEPTLAQWYARLGWNDLCMDNVHGNPVSVMQIDLERVSPPN